MIMGPAMDTVLAAAGNGQGARSALHVTYAGRPSLKMAPLLAVGWRTWDRIRAVNMQLPRRDRLPGAGRKLAI